MSDLKFYIGKSAGRHFEANVLALNINMAGKSVVLVCQCYEVDQKDGEQIKAEFSTDYSRTLIANNSTQVNPATGAPVEEGFEGAIGEWDFFAHIAANVPVKVNELIISTLMKNRARLMPDGFELEAESEI